MTAARVIPTGHADLTICDREPIHILGAIQPFAFLLALSADWLIARASANVADFLGTSPEEMIGRPLLDIFAQEAVHAIRNRLTTMRGDDATERLFGIDIAGDGRAFDIAVHLVGPQVVIEAEPSQGASDSDVNSIGMVRAMMGRLDQATGMAVFLREAARQVRALTGFDRVMVYRLGDGHGEVVAEAARSGLGSFLGLRYPGSDIPEQARALYLRNPFRVIADVAAAPVPIVPQLSPSGEPLDLSLAMARAVSPVHIEYLGNMGVAAALSISIVVEGRLWGLFACHHHDPRLPTLERRALAELFGQMFSMKLESRERQAAGEYLGRAQLVSDRILAAVAGDSGLLDNPAWLGDMLESVVPSDGVGVSINGRAVVAGLAPTEAEFARLVRALHGTAAGKVHATDRIAGLLPEAADYADRAAGMLALPISRSPRDYVVLFRQEITRTVRWAGDPNKPVDPDGVRLSPRKSFDTWTQLVSGSAAPFTPQEIRVAETLRATLIEVVLRMSDEAHVERQLAADRQELLIAELNHRVRNILSLIRSLVRQSRGSADTIDGYVREVDGRIHALARAHNQITAENWGPGSLRGLIETEAAAYLADKSERVSTSGDDVLLQPQAFSTLALVLHELVTNSVKYGGLSDSGRVEVSWKVGGEGDLHIDWRETGGPPVQAPKRQGFGSTIIQRSIPYDLGGKAEVRYLLSGLEAAFCVPARFLGQRGSGAAHPERIENVVEDAPAPVAPLAGRNVLLVEDSLMIAMDAEDILHALGAAHVTPVATIRQAIAEIDRETPSLALLDINLGEQTSLPVALRLHAMGVPFIFATGYGTQAALPAEVAHAPVLQKPYTRDGVARAVAALGFG